MFKLHDRDIAPFKNEKDLVQGFLINMSMDQTMVQRNGYTILDVLSDVGGLQGILITVITLVLGILNSNYLDNYLVSKLYKFEAATLKATQTDSIKEIFLYNCLPSKLVCCAKNRKLIAMD